MIIYRFLRFPALLIAFLLLSTLLVLCYRQLWSPRITFSVDEDRPNMFKYTTIDPKKKEINTGIIKSNMVSIDRYTPRYIDPENKQMILSNLGDDEYACRGTCVCTSEDNLRRSGTVAKSRIFTILVSAATSVLAYQAAKRHFEEDCHQIMKDSGCPPDHIIAVKMDEGESCDNVITVDFFKKKVLSDGCETTEEAAPSNNDDDEGKEEEKKKDEDDNPIRRFSCNGKCMTSVMVMSYFESLTRQLENMKKLGGSDTKDFEEAMYQRNFFESLKKISEGYGCDKLGLSTTIEVNQEECKDLMMTETPISYQRFDNFYFHQKYKPDDFKNIPYSWEQCAMKRFLDDHFNEFCVVQSHPFGKLGQNSHFGKTWEKVITGDENRWWKEDPNAMRAMQNICNSFNVIPLGPDIQSWANTDIWCEEMSFSNLETKDEF